MLQRLKKTNSLVGETRTLHKEALRMLDSASELYWHEAAKEESLRDVALMDECLDVISYASGIINKNNATEQKPLSAFFSTHTFKRFGTVFCALVVTIALTIGISYALGVDLIGIVFHVGDGNVEIEGGNTNNTNSTQTPHANTDGYVDYSSISNACEKLSVNPLIFDLTNRAFMVDNIYGAADADAHMTMLCIDYLCGENDYFYYTAYLYDNVNVAYSITMGSNAAETGKVYSNGVVNVFIAEDENGETAACWQDNQYVYQISTSLSADTLQSLINEIYS